MKKVLATGGTFFGQREIDRLAANDIEFSRLENDHASPAELVAALADCQGYFLGGLERVTEEVVAGASHLEAICFTGAGWTEFIPAHEAATTAGIPITASPGANAQAVAEYAIALVHDRVRHISYLTSPGVTERIRARNMRDLTVGIVGAGNVGAKVGRILNAAYGSAITYAGPTRKLDFEYATGAQRLPLDELLSGSDIICLHTKKTSDTDGLLDARRLGLLRDGAVVVNCAFGSVVDAEALAAELEAGRFSFASDADVSGGDSGIRERLESTGPRYFIQTGISTAYNSEGTVRVASDIATGAMIALLAGERHDLVVNPAAFEARSAS